MNEKVIFKYKLEKQITLPKDCEILGCFSKSDGEFIYALIDPHEKETETHTFGVYATGEPIPSDKLIKYIGSFILEEFYIYHVFEITA